MRNWIALAFFPCVFLTIGCKSTTPVQKQASLPAFIDGWKITASPSDTKTIYLEKDDNEIMFIYEKNPSPSTLEILNEVGNAMRNRKTKSIYFHGMSGYLEVLKLKANSSSLPPVKISAILKGPNEVLYIDLDGKGKISELQTVVEDILNDRTGKWKPLYSVN